MLDSWTRTANFQEVNDANEIKLHLALSFHGEAARVFAESIRRSKSLSP